MRRVAGILVAVGLTAWPATPAEGALTFRPCVRGSEIECGELPVPLDRAGVVPGSVKLHVERLRSRGTRQGALIALSGGPGESATTAVVEWASTFFAAGRTRDLVVFDQRGTGLSGALRCPQISVPTSRTPVGQAAGAAACAQQLGAARAFYTTPDSVEDIEAVRQALGVERIALFGVSYGTKVALAYAARYPQRVERIVLDSVVEPTAPAPFLQDSVATVPRILRTLCSGTGCVGITPDPVADVAALVQRMRTRGFVYGSLVSANGRRHRARIGSVRLLDLLYAGDFDPTLRAHFPGAVRSALAGDTAPLLRLALRADRGSSPVPAEFFSDALYVATVCEEGPLPWERSTPIGARIPSAEAALRTLPAAALHPFDRTTVLFGSSTVQLCSRWPTAPASPPILDGPFPAVPALLLSGEDDMRTPLESAQRVAARISGSTLVSVPEMGHSVLSGFPRTCGLRAVDDFFSGRALRRCPPRRREFTPVPIAPRSLSAVVAQSGYRGRPGRTLSAVALTLIDTLDQVFSAALLASPDQNVIHVGGLRAGYARAGTRTLEFHDVQYVPGVRVSGTLRMTREPHGVLHVSGGSAARGRLELRKDGSVVGKLGERRVRVSRAAATAGRIESAAWRVSAALSRWAGRSTRRSSGSSVPTSSVTTPHM